MVRQLLAEAVALAERKGDESFSFLEFSRHCIDESLRVELLLPGPNSFKVFIANGDSPLLKERMWAKGCLDNTEFNLLCCCVPEVATSSATCICQQGAWSGFQVKFTTRPTVQLCQAPRWRL